jgi:hypothetical protein
VPSFQPLYILESELDSYGLPGSDVQPNIMSLVALASSYIDEYCGKTDADGNGSLVYTTYSERILLPEGRNIFRVSFRPLVAVSVDTMNLLAASGQNYYTGFQANTQNKVGTTLLTPIISAQGRYGYARRGGQNIYPDLNYGANILQIASFFGGPPTFTTIDTTTADYNSINGEIWVPAGLYLSQYTEIVITYNAGFNPLDMPKAVKHATATLIRNLLGRAGGTLGMKSMTSGRVNVQFTDDLVDTSTDKMLQKFKTVIAI